MVLKSYQQMVGRELCILWRSDTRNIYREVWTIKGLTVGGSVRICHSTSEDVTTTGCCSSYITRILYCVAWLNLSLEITGWNSLSRQLTTPQSHVLSLYFLTQLKNKHKSVWGNRNWPNHFIASDGSYNSYHRRQVCGGWGFSRPPQDFPHQPPSSYTSHPSSWSPCQIEPAAPRPKDKTVATPLTLIYAL